MTTNGRILAALPALLALLLPSFSFGVQLGEEKPGSLLSGATMNISEVFYYKFNLFLDDDEDDGLEPPFAFHEFVSRTNVDIRFGRFTMGGQFDLVAATMKRKRFEAIRKLLCVSDGRDIPYLFLVISKFPKSKNLFL